MGAIPINRFTRIVLSLDLVFSLLAGVILYLVSTRTDRYFAWTIKLPVTATFLGAGYLGAVVTLIASYRTTDWRRIRTLPVMGFTLTAMTLLVTLWHLEQFHLGAGPAPARLAAWAWLAIYIAIPILLAAVFVGQERTRSRDAYRVDEPLLVLTRVALSIQAAGATVLGAGLVFWPAAFDVVWPWPLPPLSAGAVGAWLLTIATAFVVGPPRRRLGPFPGRRARVHRPSGPGCRGNRPVLEATRLRRLAGLGVLCSARDLRRGVRRRRMAAGAKPVAIAGCCGYRGEVMVATHLQTLSGSEPVGPASLLALALLLPR